MTTVNPVYTASEVARQFRMSRTKMVVTMEAFMPVLKDATAKLEGN